MGLCAVVAQLVERKLPKLEVAGSTPVRRFWIQRRIVLHGLPSPCFW